MLDNLFTGCGEQKGLQRELKTKVNYKPLVYCIEQDRNLQDSVAWKPFLVL